MAIDPIDRDPLELHLRKPMLDEFMRSRQLYMELWRIGNQIKAGYVAAVPKDSGDLAATARVTMHRSKQYVDRRWEAEFSVGNSRVDYAAAVEERDHVLAEVLAGLGYGDVEIF